MKNKHLYLLFALFCLLCLSATAFAAGPVAPAAPPAPPSNNLTIDDLHMTFLQGIMDWLANPAQFVNTRMLELGTSLFWAIAMLYIAFIGLKIMLDSSSVNEQMGVLINAMIPIGIIKFVLDFYIAPIPAVGMSFPVLFNNGFTYIGATMLGLDLETSMSNSVYAGLEAYMKIALILWNTFPIPGYDQGFWASLVTLWEGVAQYQIMIADFVVMCVAMLALVACGGLYIAIYTFSLMLFAVGIMLGPIMLPWKLLPSFSYLADSWVKFMVMAGMFRLVALAIIHINEIIAIGIANKMDSARLLNADFFNGVTPPNIENGSIVALNILTLPLQHMVLSLAMLVVSLLTLYMLTKVDQVTSALLTGSGSGGLSFGHGGMQTAVGAGGKSGGGIGGSGMGAQLMNRAAAAAGMAASAAGGAALKSTPGRLASSGAKAAANSSAAGKAFDALPANAQMAVGAIASASSNPNAGSSTGPTQTGSPAPSSGGATSAPNAISRAAAAMSVAGQMAGDTKAGKAIKAAAQVAGGTKMGQAAGRMGQAAQKGASAVVRGKTE